jgi:tetratricopeptide (TPR) repeat protein
VTLIGNLFGQLFGDSASEFEARGDQFAGVNNWRRALEEYQRALQKTSRNSNSFRRISAKLEEARVQTFDALIEDIHSRIDVREFTYAADQVELARQLTETAEQQERVRECEARMNGMRRHDPRPANAAKLEEPGPGWSAAPSQEREAAPGGAMLRAASGAAQAGASATGHSPVAEPAARIASPSSGQRPLEVGQSLQQRFHRLVEGLPAESLSARVALGPRYQEAALALASGDADAAVEILQELLGKHPDSMILLCDLGAALQEAGRGREALQLYAGRIDAVPVDWRAWYEMALALWKQGNRNDAVEVVQEGLAYNPRSGHLMAQWGVFLFKLGDAGRALEKFYLALQLDAFDDAGLYHTIASLHRELGEADKARRGYLKALELDPRGVGTQLEYAEFLLDKKQDARAALAILETAFRALRTPGQRRVYLSYASYLSSRAHLMLGEREMALLAVTRALEDNDLEWLAPTLETQRQAVLSV